MSFRLSCLTQCCAHIETSQLLGKSIEWFLYEGNTGTYWVKPRDNLSLGSTFGRFEPQLLATAATYKENRVLP